MKESSGNQKKLELSKGDDLLKEILYRAYHPLKKYYIKSIPWIARGSNTLQTLGPWTRLLEASSARTITGYSQQSAFKSLIESLTHADAELFKCIVLKDLKIGIGAKSINTVFPGLIPEFGFMKAKVYQPDKLKPESYMSLKIDCIRALLRNGVLYSSGGRVIPGVQHIALEFSTDEELDGELTIPGLDFNTASGKLRSNAHNPEAVLKVFDMPSIKKPFSDRYSELAYQSLHWPTSIELVKHVRIKDDAHIQRSFKKAIDNGYEGLVIKSASHLYQLKRSWDWMKLKAQDPEEVNIVGFNEGTGKYKGTLGSLRCIRSNGVLVDVSGFTELMKDHIWRNQSLWFGEVIEILYHEETPDGSLRHPRYNMKNDITLHRHRWDKSGKPLNSWQK